jgi:membrane protein implicated in regulation of membrane protease activity
VTPPSKLEESVSAGPQGSTFAVMVRCEGTAAHCAAAVLIGEWWASWIVTPLLMLITTFFLYRVLSPSGDTQAKAKATAHSEVNSRTRLPDATGE